MISDKDESQDCSQKDDTTVMDNDALQKSHARIKELEIENTTLKGHRELTSNSCRFAVFSDGMLTSVLQSSYSICSRIAIHQQPVKSPKMPCDLVPF